jgi:hypothetical protein
MYGMPPPFYGAPATNNWQEYREMIEWIEKKREDDQNKRREHEHRRRGKTFSLMEVFAILMLTSPFIGPAYIWMIKYTMASINAALQ